MKPKTSAGGGATGAGRNTGPAYPGTPAAKLTNVGELKGQGLSKGTNKNPAGLGSDPHFQPDMDSKFEAGYPKKERASIGDRGDSEFSASAEYPLEFGSQNPHKTHK